MKATVGVLTLVDTNSACLDDCSFDPIVHGRASRLCMSSRGKVSVPFNIHNEQLTPAQFFILDKRILEDLELANANPHEYSVNLVGDLNIPPPGSVKRKLDSPSAASQSNAAAYRPFYDRWANLFCSMTEIATDAHTHIITATLTTDTLDRIFTTLPKSANNILEQSATVMNSPMFYLSANISDHAPLIWTIGTKNQFCKGAFTPRPEWITHPMFLEHSTKMSDASNSYLLSVEEQKINISIVAEASARSAQETISF